MSLDRTPRGAWWVWGLGVAAYVVAVFNRGSLGVASLQAQQRFHASAAQLSLFAVLQLAVYAAMQVPVGVVLDRFGSRRLIVTGAVVMAGGQLALALAHGVGWAMVARVLVGAGDAMTFISVLRVVGLWFAPRHIPVVTQLTGIIGQVGQLAAALPLVALLRGVGWSASFVGAASVTALAGVAVAAAMRDAPTGVAVTRDALDIGALRQDLRESWREEGTRLGLWTHFVTQFSGTVFALLWGYPFLVKGEHLSASTAGALLTAMVFVGMVIGPVLGRLTAHWPLRRSVLTLSIVGTSAAMWTLVLAWPGRAPLGLLVLLVCVLASNGPGSLVGFDYARTFNPPARIGSASGIVNVGGFVASLVTILLVGVVLDITTTGGPAAYTLGDFRAAFLIQYALWAIGLGMVLRLRRRLRRRLLDEEGVVIHPLHVAIARRWSAVSARR
ncbi:MAG TPA: MFS transporter [Mycobacteriales bacterium]|nr:MFS transporter [Mycobacteriales bacterium]